MLIRENIAIFVTFCVSTAAFRNTNKLHQQNKQQQKKTTTTTTTTKTKKQKQRQIQDRAKH